MPKVPILTQHAGRTAFLHSHGWAFVKYAHRYKYMLSLMALQTYMQHVDHKGRESVRLPMVVAPFSSIEQTGSTSTKHKWVDGSWKPTPTLVNIAIALYRFRPRLNYYTTNIVFPNYTSAKPAWIRFPSRICMTRFRLYWGLSVFAAVLNYLGDILAFGLAMAFTMLLSTLVSQPSTR